MVTLSGCNPDDPSWDENSVEKNIVEILAGATHNQMFIEGGSFTMGDFGATGNDGIWRPYFPATAEKNKAHEVTLSSYSLAKHKTTWYEFDTYQLATGSPIVVTLSDEVFSRDPYDRDPESYEYIEKPAEVTWQQAKSYCLWLGEQTGLAFDLPTSAQYEFAARNRGSNKWLFATHDGKPVDSIDHPYYDAIYETGGRGPVGSRLPANPLGLYDLAGNGREWVSDWFSETYYSENSEITDPQGPVKGTKRVIRALGVGSLNFSFSHIGRSEKLSDGFLVQEGFRCAVQSPEPVARIFRN
ncbi:hypothetical protein LCGC14_0763030 [marine sediment metagenome]